MGVISVCLAPKEAKYHGQGETSAFTSCLVRAQAPFVLMKNESSESISARQVFLNSSGKQMISESTALFCLDSQKGALSETMGES